MNDKIYVAFIMTKIDDCMTSFHCVWVYVENFNKNKKL